MIGILPKHGIEKKAFDGVRILIENAYWAYPMPHLIKGDWRELQIEKWLPEKFDWD
jgi:hypothetical protein